MGGKAYQQTAPSRQDKLEEFVPSMIPRTAGRPHRSEKSRWKFRV